MPESAAKGKAETTGNELMTLEETALRLRVSETWLRRSSCPRVRFGAKTVRYVVADVMDWIDERRFRAAGAA